MSQNLIPFILLIGAFLAFLQYVERIYKEALGDIKKKGHSFYFELIRNPENAIADRKLKKIYKRVRNPRNLKLSKILAYISMGMTGTLLISLSFVAFFYSCHFALLIHSKASSDNLIPYLYSLSLLLSIVFPIMCVVTALMRFQVRSLRRDLRTMEDMIYVYRNGKINGQKA